MEVRGILSRASRRSLVFSSGTGLLLLLSLGFQWNIADVLTPFLSLPLLAAVWALAVFGAIQACIHATCEWKKSTPTFAPFAISVSALLLALFVPFTDLWLTANFNLKRSAREQVVQRVISGDLTPNVEHNTHLIALPRGSGLSIGGDEIAIEGPHRNPYVFFCTFRGMLDNYSGFLWVPSGAEPEGYSDAGEQGTQIEHLDGNWFFIGHR